MKKILSTLCIIAGTFLSGYGQTNTFPSSGNVGIGNASPNRNLVIDGGSSNDAYLKLTHSASSGSYASGVLFNNSLNGDGAIYIRTLTNTSTLSYYSPVHYFDGGNVGVGISLPSHRLQVSAGTKTNSLYVGSASSFSDRPGDGDNIFIRQPIRTSGGWWGTYVTISGSLANHTAPFYPLMYSSDENNDGSPDNNWCYIDKSGGGFFAGNIGIGSGTEGRSEKLSVNGNVSINGNIVSKKLTVLPSPWADYVFAKNYKLRSLTSLESFIKQNKHLPEVPSAKEVEEKGISVGENQALLLKKIEELTLYVISLQKQVNELKKNK
jgi:hypothetical protein